MRILFWLLATPTGALATLLILMTLGGRKLSAATPDWLALVAGAGVIGMLVWAYTVANAGESPWWAIGIVVLSWVLFAVAMTVNGLLSQKVWN